MSIPTNDLDVNKFTCLLGCAGTVMFILVSRQARISQVIRDNNEKILTVKDRGDDDRAQNLLIQNEELLQRFMAIQLVILILAVGIAALGSVAAYNFCQGGITIGFAMPFMIVAAIATVGEMATASDTIAFDVSFARWHAYNRVGPRPVFRKVVWLPSLFRRPVDDKGGNSTLNAPIR